MPVQKNGTELRTLEDWYAFAPPKSPSHWVDGRSAKESAVAWLSGGGVSMPAEVETVLNVHPSFGPPIGWQAEPEAKLAFDEFRGEPRNSDLAVYARDAAGPYVLGIEAKADEPFGKTVADALANALERRVGNAASKGLARLEQLAAGLLRPRSAGQPSIGVLRYQLLTACAGILAEAARRDCPRAVMLIHEFVTERTRDDNHMRNAADLSCFLRRLGGAAEPKADGSGFCGPYRTPGWPDIDLFIGKAVRVLRRNAALPHALARELGIVRESRN